MLALLSIVLASLYCSPLALGEVHDDEPSLIQARKVKWKADGTPKTSSKNATSSSKVKWKADGTPKTSSKNATSSSKVEWKADGNQKTRTLYSPKTTQGSKHTDNQRRTRTSHAFTEPSSSTPASQMPPDFPIDHVAPSETPGARRNSSTPASQMPPDFPIDHVAPSETPGARRNSSTPASQTLPDHGKFIDIVIGMNETQSVIRFKNPEEILIESNLQNPEASFRDVSGDLAMTVKGPGASRSSVDSNSSSLPSPSSSRRIWVSQGILERLPEEVHLELNTSSSFSDSFQENALLGRDALDAMLLALERVEPISAQLAEAGSVTQQELDGLHHETDLTQSLERVVDGSLDASAREVAKIALKALQDRSTWEANVNESLVAKQRETQFAQQMAEELLAAVQHGITSLKAFAIAANVQVNLSQVAGFFEWDRKETPGSDFMLLERAINVSVEHLRLSQSLADELLQAAAIKDNVTRQMEAALGFKENLTEQLFKKVRLTENLSHSTGLVSPEAEGGASSLAIGTSAFSTSASQAEDLAGQLQKAESTAQAFYKSTLETDLHLKLNQQKLQATLLEGLKTCGHGLRLASQASIQVDKNLSEVFRDVNGVWNAHGQTVESPDPSAAFTPDVVEAPADSSAEDLNQVETTPMFGLPQSTTAQPSRSSLPTFVIALCLATTLILSSMIGWVVSH